MRLKTQQLYQFEKNEKGVKRVHKSMRELWRIEGKFGVSNAIYAFTGNPLSAYSSKDHIFTKGVFVVRRTDGNEIGYLFDNVSVGEKQMWEYIADYISGAGVSRIFYRDGKRRLAHSTKGTGSFEIQDLIWSGYFGISPEAATAIKIRMIDNDPCMNLDGVEIYSLSQTNLVSDNTGSAQGITYTLLHKERDIVLTYWNAVKQQLLSFHTEYFPELYNILHLITHWKVEGGALKALIRVPNEKRQSVAFSEIVWLYHCGKIDLKNVLASILSNHKALMAKNVVIDHLTGCKEANYIWALAPVSASLNTQMRERHKIRPPYYFFTVYDSAVEKYKVKLGAYGFGWERRYLFDNISYKNTDNVFDTQFDTPSNCPDITLYAKLFQDFKSKIGCKRNRGTGYLEFWAKPERVYDDANILMDMLYEPAEVYTDALELYTTENWDDMPNV